MKQDELKFREKTKRIHYFDGQCDPAKGNDHPWSWCKTFSVGIFPMILRKDGVRYMRGKVIVRVRGPVERADEVRALADKLCEQLDLGKYEGPKNVVLK